jgi:hypothetical protein
MSRLADMTDDERSRLLAELKTLGAERARLTRERDAVTRQLADVAKVLLTKHGTSELTIAKAAGVDRKTVRVWHEKEDWRGRKGE